ncbi:hypothetical protein ACFV1C_27215 [Streptomyces sp. NPDC059605]
MTVDPVVMSSGPVDGAAPEAGDPVYASPEPFGTTIPTEGFPA